MSHHGPSRRSNKRFPRRRSGREETKPNKHSRELEDLKTRRAELEKGGTRLMRAEGELWDAASAFTEYRGHDKGLTKGAGKLAKKTNDLRIENFKKQEQINKRIDKLEA